MMSRTQAELFSREEVRLIASWHGGENWDPWPIPYDLKHLLLLTCFVSESGWAAIESRMRETLKQNQDASAQLLFSLEGSAKLHAPVFRRVLALVKEFDNPSRLDAYFVKDKRSRLFHPKALATATKRGDCRVVVGSANLTQGGYNNYELALVAEQPASHATTYRALVQSVNTLIRAKLVVKLADEKAVEEATKCARARTSRARSQPSVTGDGATEQTRPPALHRLLIDESAQVAEIVPHVNASDAHTHVQRFLERGFFIRRSDPMTTFSVSVSLAKFRKANILCEAKNDQLGVGLSLNRRGTTINVSLVPEDITARITEKRKNIGRLLSHFTIETFAGLWMPLDWMDTFERNWAHCLGDDKLADYKPRIADHLAGLNDALIPSAEQIARYVKQFGICSPEEWKEDAFKKVGAAKPTKKLTENRKKKLMELAVISIYDHIRTRVGSQNSPIFVLSQIERVEQPARIWRARIASRNDSADILADLLIAGSAAMVRCHAKSSPKSGVAQVIHDRLISQGYSGEAALEIFRCANAWKRQVITDPLEQKDDTLARSWACFKQWTGLSPEDWPWDACVPRFQVKSEKDAEEVLGENSDE